MKDEGYTDVKHARGINSRSDPFKVVSGPLFHAIECVVFQLPEFIKYVPVRERAKHLFDELWEPGVTFVITDYTSFECGFVLLMMDACEFELYIFMLRHTPALMAMFIICWQVLGGENVCTFKYFVIWVFATRMSGEMCTSLGNGFSNLCLMAFACHLSGVTWKGRFEGDDGVAAVRGTINKKIFKRLGMRIKLKKVERLEEASFCGLIFDPDHLQIITDPIKVLCSFAWGKARYRAASENVLKQLLRAKALSFMYQYPACPIVTELARFALRMTRNVRIRKSIVDKLDMYTRRIYLEALQCKNLDIGQSIGMGTRCLMERQFGVSVSSQLRVESLFRNKQDLLPIDLFELDFPESLCSFMDQYCLQWPVGDDKYIGEWWAKRPNYKEW